jgi:hypothetical protein
MVDLQFVHILEIQHLFPVGGEFEQHPSSSLQEPRNRKTLK